MSNDTVLTEKRGAVLLVTLNRPDAMNALNADVTAGLLAAYEQLDSDPALGAGVLTGAGRGFCAGMDLKAFTESGIPDGLFAIVEQVPSKPLIAAVEGFALAGGLELAVACDLIVATRGAKLGIPEVGVGLVAAAGGLFRLPRRVPQGVAMRMALTGDPISAEEAFQHGLVTELAEKGEAVDVAVTIAERVARNAPLAVTTSKRIIRELGALPDAEAWTAQQPLIDAVFGSPDADEGPRAFAEKRAPEWSANRAAE